MEKLNIAEILKDCPKGMELDCTLFDDIYFDCIDDVCDIIKCYIQESKHKIGISFDKYGHYSNISKSKCVIFPKGKTTWEGFQRPFKDGDIIFTHANCLKVGLGNTWISIFKEKRNGGVATYVDYAENGSDYYSDLDGDKAFLCMEKDILRQRLATEEEKEKLFQAIKDNGYHWNVNTKTLEKLVKPRFKVGDRIKATWNNNQYDIKGLTDTHYVLVEVDYQFKYTEPISEDKNWELIPNKFDITTLNPFDKVLVRDSDKHIWCASIFSNTWKNKYYCVGMWHNQCIPYEGNEHLLGTTNDCDEYYKNW